MMDVTGTSDFRASILRRCLDRSERRPHLAGALPALLLDHMLTEKRLIRRKIEPCGSPIPAAATSPPTLASPRRVTRDDQSEGWNSDANMRCHDLPPDLDLRNEHAEQRAEAMPGYRDAFYGENWHQSFGDSCGGCDDSDSRRDHDLVMRRR